MAAAAEALAETPICYPGQAFQARTKPNNNSNNYINRISLP